MNHRITRFHAYHGTNISLNADRTVAYRKRSFANAVTFSEEPLLPGEIFLIEVEENDLGCSGHVRIGLTQLLPSMISKLNLPQHALPDMNNLGSSWIYSIAKFQSREPKRIQQKQNGYVILRRNATRKSILGVSSHIRTPRGMIPKRVLLPNFDSGNADELPTAQGSRIGIVVVPTKRDKNIGELYFIINGVDQGPITEIPTNGNPLHVVMDVCAATNKIRIIQLEADMSLLSACRNVILENIKKENIEKLPLPTTVKAYLRESV